MANTEIAKRFKLKNPGHLDSDYGPYANVAAACAAIPNIEKVIDGVAVNYRNSKTVAITTVDGLVEYWWKASYLDAGLVVKTAASSGSGDGGGTSGNRHPIFVLIDSYESDTALYNLTTLAGDFVITSPDGTVLFKLGHDTPAPPPVPVPVTVNFANDESSAQDSNVQVKVIRDGVVILEPTLFYTGSDTLTAQVGDTITVEGFSTIETVTEPFSPAWTPGTVQTLQVSGFADLTTTDNPGSMVRSKVLTDATTITINCFTTA